MSAGRNASSLLISLIITVILFVVFAAASSLGTLERHAYMPNAGWEQPKASTPAGIIGGVCAPTAVTSGFPLASSRQAEIPHNCLKATNPVARAMNFALSFALAAIVSVALVVTTKGRRT